MTLEKMGDEDPILRDPGENQGGREHEGPIVDKLLGPMLKPEWTRVLLELEQLNPETFTGIGYKSGTEYLLAIVINLASQPLAQNELYSTDPKYFPMELVRGLVEGVYDPREAVRLHILSIWENKGIVEKPS